MIDMDWEAAMDSEIFRIYAKNELIKQAQETTKKLQVEPEDAEKILEAFVKFEQDIKTNPTKLKVFQALQNKFASDPEYTAKVKKSFVEAVMLLNLD